MDKIDSFTDNLIGKAHKVKVIQIRLKQNKDRQNYRGFVEFPRLSERQAINFFWKVSCMYENTQFLKKGDKLLTSGHKDELSDLAFFKCWKEKADLKERYALKYISRLSKETTLDDIA